MTAQLSLQTTTPDRAGETGFSGVYEATLTTRDGKALHRRFALNIDQSESDLAIAENPELRSALDPVRVRVFSVDEELDAGDDLGRNTWSQWLLGILIVLLLIEQWLAYVLSYHPAQARVAGGVTS